MFKRVLAVVLIFAISAAVSACGGGLPEQDKISIVCTGFATYDWTREIIGSNADKFDLTLLGGGIDMHSFQPTAEDIAKIHTADLFVQIGGITEEWTKALDLEEKKTLNLLSLLDDTEKLNTADKNHQHKFSENDFDEHIWLSLKLAQKMAEAICKSICELDKVNGVQYQKNCAGYIEKLKALDKEYETAVEGSKSKIIIFADRFPFAYLAKDYDITCFSAFDSCSSDTNASFDTIIHLAEEVKKHNKDTVLVLEASAESVVIPLKNALGGQIPDTAVMNSCQTMDGKTAQNTSYIEIMTQNLEALKKALRG